ncbi:protein phosphatase 1 regulatory subunit 7 [Jimgerdemannia flammicorona]|uniref:Protein phosphatase 1 regulatory subunit 7 n=1 Tax=Jimgerdemannia flammicorona TaxID=994334 RepID=A0A433CZX6_9FUNG|nr:protein phosphatase 1 regulatory subunit 7 [Jimgerdemannia flammicorona]
MADMKRSWSKNSAANSIDSDASDPGPAYVEHTHVEEGETDLARAVRVQLEKKAEETRKEEEEEKEGHEGLLVKRPYSSTASHNIFRRSTSHRPRSQELELVHCRLKDLASLGLSRFKNLQKLCVRQNLITHIDGLDTLSQLKELDMYDNKISHVRNLGGMTVLEYLDLSFNKIKTIAHLDHLTTLTNLFFVSNKISRIDGLETLTLITNLELGANRIRVIEGLDTLVNLEQLWLGKNKITKLEANNNLLSSFEELEQQLADKRHLSTVYLEGNPMQRDNQPTYRTKVKLAVPQVKQIDATRLSMMSTLNMSFSTSVNALLGRRSTGIHW